MARRRNAAPCRADPGPADGKGAWIFSAAHTDCPRRWGDRI